MFDARLLSAAPFTPHLHAALESAFPPGAMPEAAYAKLCAQFALVEDVRVSRIVYESGGHRVTGLMAEPDGGGPLPVALYQRGGKGEYGKLTVYNVMQAMVPLARAGYLAFASNYRGNDGGDGTDAFGGAEVEDILTLLSVARAHPRWDGKNAYLLGHSRGGMMTLLALRAGAEANAAALLAPITDLRGENGAESEFTRYLPPDEQGKPAALAARSAVAWAQELRTPLLLQHGDRDERIPAAHSIALNEALDKTDTPHRLVLYPGGNHSLFRDWKEVMEETLEWFGKYRR